jgi:1,2-diacylglycerol 3-alpha-glucosyltransferase
MTAREGSRKHRVAMVATCPFPSLRGSQVLIRELAENLARAGHEVHVVTYPAGEHIVPVRGIAVHRVPALLGLDGSGSWWGKLLLDLTMVGTLYRVVRDHRIDLIHAHNYEGPAVGYLVRALLGTPVVYHTHNAMSDELPYYFQRFVRRWIAALGGRALDRLVPRLADHCIALTPELTGYLLARGVRPDRIETAPPGVAMPTSPDPASVSRLFPGREVVLYAGNIDPYQDLDVLLRAHQQVRRVRPDVLLVLASHPARAPEVRARLAALGELPGTVVLEANTFNAVQPLIARADVVVCSRSSWSGFPIKLLNFMSFGRAIVVCRSAAKTVCDGVTGVVVPDGDVEGMAAAIVDLLEDGQRRADLGRAARREVSLKYSWKVVLPIIERVYESTLRRRPDPEVRTGAAEVGKLGREVRKIA